MKTTVTFCDFCDAFRNADRNENFSYEGKRALFDYLEEYEESSGDELELDVIAICCDYTEADWQEIADDYRIDLSDCDDDDEKQAVVVEYMENNTTLITVDADRGIYIYQAF